jgi:signal transduction histidine kinase
MQNLNDNLPLLLARPARRGTAVAVVIAAILACMLGVELLLPRLITLSAFVFIPVLAAAWLLRRSPALLMLVLAVAVRFVGLVESSQHPVTVAAEILILVTIGAVTIVAADSFRKWHDAQSHLREQAADLAAAAERERIAGQLTDELSRGLFAITVDLQAAMGIVEQDAPRRRIASAMSALDAQIASLRHVVFKRRPAQ